MLLLAFKNTFWELRIPLLLYPFIQNLVIWACLFAKEAGKSNLYSGWSLAQLKLWVTSSEGEEGTGVRGQLIDPVTSVLKNSSVAI